MRLSRSYQPRTLDEVVGQPAVIRRLKRLVAAPSACSLLLEGVGGIGKSATAKALISDLGVSPYAVTEYAGSDLHIDDCRRLFEHAYKLKPMFGSPWNVLLVEELERAASAEVNSNLKRNLSEQNMPERLIVVATSNDASGLDEALLQRFEVFPFSAGPTFAKACQERLAWIWQQEAGVNVPMPLGMEQMGWRNGNYSMRRAMTALGGALELRCGEEVAA